jgi:hypothetical protein
VMEEGEEWAYLLAFSRLFSELGMPLHRQVLDTTTQLAWPIEAVYNHGPSAPCCIHMFESSRRGTPQH